MSEAPVHGFDQLAIKRTKAMLGEVAAVLVQGRPDAAFLWPKLVTSLTVELNDFVRYNQRDASEGFASPAERKRLIELGIQSMQAWDAQK